MIRIYGASDDLVEVEADDGTGDEIGSYEQETTILVGTIKAGVVVRFTYGPRVGEIGAGGTWQARIDLVDEDIRFPWKVGVDTSERGYSPVIVIDCPNGTPWRVLGQRKDAER